MQLCDSLRDRATIFPRRRRRRRRDLLVSLQPEPVFRASRLQNEMLALVIWDMERGHMENEIKPKI